MPGTLTISASLTSSVGTEVVSQTIALLTSARSIQTVTVPISTSPSPLTVALPGGTQFVLIIPPSANAIPITLYSGFIIAANLPTLVAPTPQQPTDIFLKSTGAAIPNVLIICC